jgi:hypothetical protein
VTLIGVVGVRDSIHLYPLFVAEAFRGQGIAGPVQDVGGVQFVPMKLDVRPATILGFRTRQTNIRWFCSSIRPCGGLRS